MIGSISVVLNFHFTSTYFRYVYPAAVILIAAMGVAFENGVMRGVGISKVLILLGFCATVALNLLFLNSASWYGDFALRPIFDSQQRDKYVAQRIPERAAVELVNKLNTAGNKVAFVSSPFIAGLKADALLASWYNQKFLDEVLAINSDIEAYNLLVDRSVDYLILDRNWPGPGNQHSAQVRYLEKVTTEIAVFGPISIRKIDPALRFRRELLINPDFKSKDGWNFAQKAWYETLPNSVQVSESEPVTQEVGVVGGRQYRNIVVARCVTTPTVGRLQINWHDIRGTFLKADLVTFTCSDDWEEHQMTVTAPADAVSAMVYTTGHTATPLAYRLNSLLE